MPATPEECRAYRRRNPEKCRQYKRLWRARHPEKKRAQNAVYRALKSGKLTKQPCHWCFHTKVEAHHDDYDRPLDVIWLCRPCHMKYHRLLREASYAA